MLEGFDYHDQRRIGAVMERELGRLIREGGLPSGIGLSKGLTEVDAGLFTGPPDGNPRIIGVQVARSIYKGLTPRSHRP